MRGYEYEEALEGPCGGGALSSFGEFDGRWPRIFGPGSKQREKVKAYLEGESGKTADRAILHRRYTSLLRNVEDIMAAYDARRRWTIGEDQPGYLRYRVRTGRRLVTPIDGIDEEPEWGAEGEDEYGGYIRDFRPDKQYVTMQ